MPGHLDNPRADRIKRVRGLFHSSGRRRSGLYVAEGPQAVREAATYAIVDDLYVSDDAARRYPEILTTAEQRQIRTFTASPEVMEALSGDAQGIVAVVAHGGETGPIAAGDLAAALGSARLVAVFAEMQDPGNAGTAIRAADAAGADAVVLCTGSVEATNPKVVRSSAGSLFHLPVFTGVPAEDAIEAAGSAGLRVLAADGHGDMALDKILTAPAARVAWVFGNEARGLPADLQALADQTVRIPLLGKAESLNLAQAATLCLYATAYAQRRGSQATEANPAVIWP